MKLGTHTRTQKGTFRKERGDAKIGNLRVEYPVLKGINGNMQLKTLEKRLNVKSLSQVLKELKGI